MLTDEPHSSQAADIPQLFNLNDVNDLVRDLGLTKGKLELISSKWKQWNILQKGVNCTYIRSRHANLQDFFSAQNNECYCINIDGVFKALESEHHSIEWRLFIDSSKASLKAVLLNNGSEKPSISLVHATALKETLETMELNLRLINCSAYNWNICGNIKVIGLLLGMQMDYIKLHWFLCFWDSTTMSNIYQKRLTFT